ncbi:2OG-Fe(II) oxygenase [Pseudomonas capsici]|uniref:cyclophane-containing peptide 2OG-Fe(II) oxygenase YhhC n=1 Tax=Pseudomonas capsici TaxID=2810614 RepID=UPI0019D29AE5|nr:cyclophane-containing peptide 2OG-Fe(II) oxygenase YhhC [Pseudomonas capsici]MBN6716022.1 2OG-Fe(II) oxygenase [Pseudomonas capsici]MBN6720518.1 2OG-Fe(II) oxygenase [Pseudomonas capsici]MBN6725974.1 2OG-Fe(II) oxygenase [Pseudomonas capsici]
MTLPNFINTPRMAPFPHALQENALSDVDSEVLLTWLEGDAPWKLKIAEFYQQYEFSFHGLQLPDRINRILSTEAIRRLRENIEKIFRVNLSERIDITAHKLIGSQVIKIHNDFIPKQETHRVLIQLNRGWTEENGGILMIFSDRTPESLSSAFLPLHNTAFAFEISPRSFHAVSAINSGKRFTIVFSFFKDEK